MPSKNNIINYECIFYEDSINNYSKAINLKQGRQHICSIPQYNTETVPRNIKRFTCSKSKDGKKKYDE